MASKLTLASDRSISQEFHRLHSGFTGQYFRLFDHLWLQDPLTDWGLRGFGLLGLWVLGGCRGFADKGLESSSSGLGVSHIYIYIFIYIMNLYLYNCISTYLYSISTSLHLSLYVSRSLYLHLYTSRWWRRQRLGSPQPSHASASAGCTSAAPGG